LDAGEDVPVPDEGGVRAQRLPARYNAKSELTAQLEPGKNTFTFELSADPRELAAEAESIDDVAVADKRPSEDAETPAGEDAEASSQPSASPSEATKAEVTEFEASPAEDRPEWVDATPRKLGSVYQMKVDVGPYSDKEELDREYPQALQTGVDEYVMEHLREPRARGKIHLPLDYVRNEIVSDQWYETLQVQISPEGQVPVEYVPMTQRYVLLEFDHAVNARIEEEWEKVVVTERLYGVGSLAGMVLMLMAGVYAYLKIDLATAGAYRGRLRLAAAALLALAIAAGLGLVAGTSTADRDGPSSEALLIETD
jgi:hypothetical protein